MSEGIGKSKWLEESEALLSLSMVCITIPLLLIHFFLGNRDTDHSLEREKERKERREGNAVSFPSFPSFLPFLYQAVLCPLVPGDLSVSW